MGNGAHVRVRGKGRRQRTPPLREDAAALLREWLQERQGDDLQPLFPSNRNRRPGRDTVAWIVGKHVRTASETCPSLRGKRISPHSPGHTTAMVFLRESVPITVIALWLGHQSVESTMKYVHADPKLKEDAMEKTSGRAARTLHAVGSADGLSGRSDHAEKLERKSNGTRGSDRLFRIVRNSAYCQLCRIRHSWHACQHLQVCADDVFGKGSKAWFRNCRDILRDDPNGIGRTIEAIRYRVRSGCGGKDLKRELNFFRNNRRRMKYRSASDQGYGIGSGALESSNKNLVQHRMKRRGQRLGRESGQAVLDFRSLVKSNRFDAACRGLLRHRRAKAPVATDLPPLARAA